MSDDYRPWDREEKLGPPPWKSDDPKLIAWERAHGHDVRLKCYPEFGCQVIEARAEAIETAARNVVAAALDAQTTIREAIIALEDALGGVAA